MSKEIVTLQHVNELIEAHNFQAAYYTLTKIYLAALHITIDPNLIDNTARSQQFSSFLKNQILRYEELDGGLVQVIYSVEGVTNIISRVKLVPVGFSHGQEELVFAQEQNKSNPKDLHVPVLAIKKFD